MKIRDIVLAFSGLWALSAGAQAAESLVVPLTTANHVYFVGGDNQREKSFTSALPADISSYNEVILHFKLSCPSGRCDPWDRVGDIKIENNDEEKTFIELLRFITPYGIGGEWSLDVTDYWPLLQGEKNFKVFIDTWVGPGSVYGDGWLVDLSLEYKVGVREQTTVLIAPVVNGSSVKYGDPLVPTARSNAVLPLIGFRSAKILTTITGHGQGNLDNCAEFCPKVHSLTVGKAVFEKSVWRDDCETTVDPLQQGTWWYPRAGWCPGDIVRPWAIDVSHALTSVEPVVKYDVEAFENTCRPDSLVCAGCLYGSCDYDGGGHTEPYYKVTSLVFYKN